MPFIFHCPYCQSPMTVTDHLAGTAATCVSCRRPITLPAGPAPAAPPQVVPPTPPPATSVQPAAATPPDAAAQAAPTTPPRRRRSPAVAIVFVVIVLGVFGGGGYLAYRAGVVNRFVHRGEAEPVTPPAGGEAAATSAEQPAAGSASAPGAEVSFRAKALGLITISPNWTSGPYHFWLLESVEPAEPKHWAVDCETSTQSVGLRGQKFDEGTLRGAVDLKLQLDQSSSMRRFFSGFDPQSVVDVTGARPAEGADCAPTLTCPLPESLSAGSRGNGVTEFPEAAPLEDIPVVVNATLSKPAK